MKRLFVDVKTALFAVEYICGSCIVYDCGSVQTNKCVNKAINRLFVDKSEIEAVFISHYDSDHINGVQHLLNHCRVKRLILPMLPKALLLYMLSTQQYSKEEREFVLAPNNYVQERNLQTEILYVSEDSEERGNDNSTISFDGLGDNIAYKQLSSGTKLTISSDFHWAFIPYNIRILSKKEEEDFMNLLAASVKLTLDEFQKIGVKEIWKKYDLQIKNAIKKSISGLNNRAINATSMTLYSGPWLKECGYGKVGCLYLGDYDASTNYNQLEKAYADVLDFVGVIQIPHHGSMSYFNDKLVTYNMLAVISVSIPNNKIKPKQTIDRILELNGIPLITGYRKDISIEYAWHYNKPFIVIARQG